MCDFAEPWFGAHYPDSYCVDGYLHDADKDGHDPDDVSNPCPKCNTAEYLLGEREQAESTESMGWLTRGGMKYMSGVDIWNNAKAWAVGANPEAAAPAIAELEKRPDKPLEPTADEII